MASEVRTDDTIIELRVELANLDMAIAALEKYLGCASGGHKSSNRKLALVQGKKSFLTLLANGASFRHRVGGALRGG